MCTDKNMSHKENKGVIVNTEKPTTKTPVTPVSAVNDTPSKEPTSPDISSLNTEKTGEIKPREPAGTSIEQDLDNTTITDSISAENGAVNTENNTANPKSKLLTTK